MKCDWVSFLAHVCQGTSVMLYATGSEEATPAGIQGFLCRKQTFYLSFLHLSFHLH